MVLLFDIFLKNWNRIAIIKIIKDEIKAKKNELLIGFGPNYNAPNLSFEGSLIEAASNLFSF